jgi:hypothetical protein
MLQTLQDVWTKAGDALKKLIVVTPEIYIPKASQLRVVNCKPFGSAGLETTDKGISGHTRAI